MSDVIEQELREAFATRVEPVVPRIVGRLSAVDFLPGRARIRLFTRIGAAGGLITAGGVAAVLLLGSGTQEAFAGWTAVPASVTASSLSAARRACGISQSARVLAAEARGPFVAIVYVDGHDPWQCITRGSTRVMKDTTQYPARLYEAVPADKITAPSLAEQAYTESAKRHIAKLNKAEQRLIRKHDIPPIANLDDQIQSIKTGPDALISLTGTAGKGVSAVRFTLADGRSVSATVQGGWYEAWWPGSSKPGGAAAVHVQLATDAGARATRMTYQAFAFSEIGPGHCAPRAVCSVFAPVALRQGIAPALMSHFAFFKHTAPASASSLPKLVRRMSTNPLRVQIDQSYGIGARQTRAVKLPGGNVDLIMPGTEGMCETFASHNSSAGGCEDLQSVLRWGEMSTAFSSQSPTGRAYTLHGLVPNGNRTVTVNMVSGPKLVVPVHDNIVYATFATEPRSITFRNAFGNIKHYPAD